MGVSFFHDRVSKFVRNGYNSLFSRRAFCGRLDFLSLVTWLGKCHIVIFLFGRAGNASLILRILVAELIAWA